VVGLEGGLEGGMEGVDTSREIRRFGRRLGRRLGFCLCTLMRFSISSVCLVCIFVRINSLSVLLIGIKAKGWKNG
jgi:hypothetical protein